MKRCPKCGISKSFKDFHSNSSKRDGLQDYCKACLRARRLGDITSLRREHEKDCECKTCMAPVHAASGLKLCAKCGVVKPFGEFYKDHKMSGGLNSYCKSCDIVRVVEGTRKRNFHMTPEDLRERIAEQGGLCASCGDPMDVNAFRGVAVDHDHQCCPGLKSCGECVRGILCASCNLAIGMIKDDPDRALALATYLMRFKDVLHEGV